MGCYQDKILEIMTREDLNEELKFVSDAAGIEVAKLLIKGCGGSRIYIPKLPLQAVETFFKQNKKAFSNIELKNIALDTGHSESRISEIYRRTRIKIPDNKQSMLFYS